MIGLDVIDHPTSGRTNTHDVPCPECSTRGHRRAGRRAADLSICILARGMEASSIIAGGAP